MKNGIIKLLLSIILFTSFSFKFHTKKNSLIIIEGQYRLNYTEKLGRKKMGWTANHREEVITLNNDSTFVLVRISQGGFEVLPDSGKWSYTNSQIILDTYLSKVMVDCDYVPKKRIFKIVDGGLIEPNCLERIFSKTIWKKE